MSHPVGSTIWLIWGNRCQRVQLQSANDWEKHLKHILSSIDEQFNITNEWSLYIENQIINKDDPLSFQTAIASKPSPIVIEIRVNSSHRTSNKSFIRSQRRKEPENIFSEEELDEIKIAITQNQQNGSVPKGWQISWNNVANCVDHEMYPKLGSAIRAIINSQNENNIELYDLNDKSINKMIEILKTKRNLAVEERNYLRGLFERARDFIPIDNVQKSISSYDSYDDKDKMDNGQDFHVKMQGLNKKLLQDIFDVHRFFKFSSYHFMEYSMNDFRTDLFKAGDKYLGTQFVRQYISGILFEDRMNFHPSYIVHDDMFEIFRYVVGVTQYVHYLRNNMKNRLKQHFQIKFMVIPRSVVCVYNQYANHQSLNN